MELEVTLDGDFVPGLGGISLFSLAAPVGLEDTFPCPLQGCLQGITYICEDKCSFHLSAKAAGRTPIFMEQVSWK